MLREKKFVTFTSLEAARSLPIAADKSSEFSKEELIICDVDNWISYGIVKVLLSHDDVFFSQVG